MVKYKEIVLSTVTDKPVEFIERKTGWKTNLIKSLSSNGLTFVLKMINKHERAEARLDQKIICSFEKTKGESS